MQRIKKKKKKKPEEKVETKMFIKS